MGLVRWASLVGVGLLGLLGSRTAEAFPTAQLVYSRGAGTEACPDRDAVRTAVTNRLGYDPFDASSEKMIVARIVRESDQLRAEVELVDEHGARLGQRELSAPLDQCDDLLHAMALSISIAIDPERAESVAEAPQEPGNATKDAHPPAIQAPAPVTEARPTRPAAKRDEPSNRFHWSVGFGPIVQLGVLPKLTVGGTAFGALRRDRWSLALEGELDLPVTTREQDVAVRSTSLALKLVPCGTWRTLIACQVTAVRWLGATGSASHVGGRSSALAFGARLGIDLPVTAWLAARPYAEVLATPGPVRLLSDGREVWRTPLLSGALGIAAVAHF